MKPKYVLQHAICSLLFILLPAISHAQLWFPSGATWHYGFDIPMGGTGYNKLSIAGDTIINTQPCKIMHRESFWKYTFGPFQNMHYNNFGNAYLFADADHVYIYHNQAFYTLYDFSAPIGASWQIPENYNDSPCDTAGFVTVTDTGSITVNSQNLRYFKATPSAGSAWFFGTAIQGDTVTVIEKLGAVIGKECYFLPASNDLCNGAVDDYGEGQLTSFRCYSDSTGFVYQVVPDCEFITGIQTIDPELTDIRISHDPSSHSLAIQATNNTSIKEVNVYNSLGQCQQSITPNALEVNLSLNESLKGIFVVEVGLENKMIRKKIIVE